MQLHIEYSRITNQNFQFFINSSNVSIMNVTCLQLTLYLNRLFSMSLSTSCSNTQSKSVAKCYTCTHVQQIILIINKSPSSRHDVGHDNPLAYPDGAFAINFTPESQFSYLFAYKKCTFKYK